MQQRIVVCHTTRPVCLAAEQQIAQAIAPPFRRRGPVSAEGSSQVDESESVVVQSLSAPVIGGQPIHLNVGVATADLT